MWFLALSAALSAQVIYHNEPRKVAVHFGQSARGEVQFSSYMPAGWSFRIDLDGDHNKRWGVGSGEAVSYAPTADKSFGQDTRNGIYCSQYIYTSDVKDPSEVYGHSRCGGLPSKGHVEISGMDENDWATVSLKMPAEDLFAKGRTADIRVCLYSIKGFISCEHSVANPLILKRR